MFSWFQTSVFGRGRVHFRTVKVDVSGTDTVIILQINRRRRSIYSRENESGSLEALSNEDDNRPC